MSSTRMFIAIRPPRPVREELAQFLVSRDQLPWIDAEQWHVTLAFLAAVPERVEDTLIDTLRRTCLRHEQFELSLAGAGAFPDALRARVLWLRPRGDLTALATGVRHACNASGATPDGQRFVGHLSLARLRRPIDARKWLQILDTFAGSSWPVRELELLASYLGEGPSGRPRYEVVARLPLRESDSPGTGAVDAGTRS